MIGLRHRAFDLVAPGKRGAKLRVLGLFLEFGSWCRARAWTYAAQLGLEEGFRAQGARVSTVTTPWLPRLREFCGGRRFDQVWVEVVHQDMLDDDTLSWIAERAPVRVGLVAESLTCAPEESLAWPEYRTRKAEVKHRLEFCTHAALVDEVDAAEIEAEGKVRALWWPGTVPRRFVADEVSIPPGAPAIFAGSIYGIRATMLQDDALKGLVVVQDSPELGRLPARVFERLHKMTAGWVERRWPSQAAIVVYLVLLRRLRRRMFRGWLQSLRRGGAVVNLPHLVRSYPGRVVEAMAVGRPVIAWDVPDRPRNRALFEDGQEILLYRGTDPRALADVIRRLHREPGLGPRIAERALDTVRRAHITEHRVRQAFVWIETGEAPDFA